MAGESFPRTRRSVIAAAAGGLAAFVASAFGRSLPAEASAGQALIMGSTSNSAGTSNTTLTTNSSGSALSVVQNGSGTGLRGKTAAAGSYAVNGTNAGAAGSGGAVRAAGGHNNGLVATTGNGAKYAVRATNTAASGHAYGVAGFSSSPSGSGVYGSVGSDTGSPIGVYGEALGAVGDAVYGFAQGAGTGVYGNSNDGRAVWGDQGGTSSWAGYFTGRVALKANATTYFEMDEYLPGFNQSPTVAPAQSARLFVKDNGSGKAQLCVIFPSGAAIVLATEV